MRLDRDTEAEEEEANETEEKIQKESSRSGVKYTAAMLVLKAAIISGVILLINLLYPSVITTGISSLQVYVLFTGNFLLDFIVVFIILLVYDILLEHEALPYSELLGGIAAGVVLTTGIYAIIQLPQQLPSSYSIAIVLFVALLAAFLVGAAAKKIPGFKYLIMALIVFIALGTLANRVTTGPIGNALQNSSLLKAPIPQNAIVNYTLSLINNDRTQYGLQPVTLSNEPSAQQHAESMLKYGYFSHWDPFGLKPYMRYTLLGGRGAVTENVAYIYYSLGISPEKDIEQMEHSMIYNDSICCNNGHRDNILNPSHNQVSIGVAYSATTIYLVEDFINNYINWTSGSPDYNNGVLFLDGNMAPGYSLHSIEIAYDPPINSMSVAQLDNTSEYGYGDVIAGVVSNSRFYYPNLTTITASEYLVNGNSFSVSFNMSKLVDSQGSGEYTLQVWLANQTSNAAFVASTYTVFINSAGQPYTPSSI